MIRDLHVLALGLASGASLYFSGCNTCNDPPPQYFAVGEYVVTGQTRDAGKLVSGEIRVPQLKGAAFRVLAPHSMELRYVSNGENVIVRFGPYGSQSGQGGGAGEGGGGGGGQP